MTKFILGLIVGAVAMAFFSTPHGKAVFAAFSAQFEAPPAIVAVSSIAKADEEEVPPPPVSPETAPASPEEAPVPAPPVHSGPDDTFQRVMEVYERDGKASAEEAEEIEQIKP